MTYDPLNNNVFYVGTGEIYTGAGRGFGIWKTEDGGDSWYHLSGTEDFYYVNDLVVRAENGVSILYAAVGMKYYEGAWHYGAHGLYRSVDQGGSFAQVLPAVGSNNQPYQPSDLELGSDNSLWVGTRKNAWWDGANGEDFSGQVPTYFGGTTRHEMMERTVWHSTQHMRQVASLLEQVGITPDQPLTKTAIEGLPLTDAVWDE